MISQIADEISLDSRRALATAFIEKLDLPAGKVAQVVRMIEFVVLADLEADRHRAAHDAAFSIESQLRNSELLERSHNEGRGRI
jgi:hypothetical protein